MELTDEEFQNIIDGFLKSVLHGMQAIILHFQERGEDHLVNVSSALGRVPLVSHRSIYSAVQGGVKVITVTLRMDLRARYSRIHISFVMPGIVDTNIHRVAQTPQRMEVGECVGPRLVQNSKEATA